MNKIEELIVSKVIKNEWDGSKDLATYNDEEFLSYVRLMDSVRDEKQYDWMSNIRIPEFASQMLTQSSIDVDQYFKSRDFVEVYLQDESDEAVKSSAATKELINRTLNQPDIHHYLKFVRAKLINHLSGRVYAECWWDKETSVKDLGKVKGSKDPIRAEVIIKDHFNYDIIDPRMIRVSPEYSYSARDQEWIIIEKLKTMSWLKDNAETFGFFNLDEVEKNSINRIEEILKLKGEKFTGKQIYNPNIDQQKLKVRYGKFWAKVDEVDPVTEKPLKVSYGYDEEGNVLSGAELVECVITFAHAGNTPVLIGFKLSDFTDCYGDAYKPIIRGLCYVHPTDSSGIGDGLYARDLQTALDDTFNLSNDRTMLATMPVFKGRKDSLTDNDTIYFKPEHVIELQDVNDLEEVKIDDNTIGALNQAGFLISKLNQTMSIYPTTMGGLSGNSGTTATEVAGAESRTGIRTSYKSTTFEYTFLLELYWMIIQMTHQYAFLETGKKLIGDKINDFDPTKDYLFLRLLKVNRVRV
jgi:hypothetical protein